MSDKPRGYFKNVLVIDSETTGLCMGQESPVYNAKTGERHQTVSWGIIVADTATFTPVEKLYVEIKWNETSKQQRKANPEFGKRAEAVHGLTYEYLEANGKTEQEAVVEIGNLIMKHFGPNHVRTLGHNVATFDVPFLRDLFERHDIPLDFGNRHVDTNSIGFATFGTFNSDDLFELIGFEHRENHNALTDAEQALETTRVIRTIFQQAIK